MRHREYKQEHLRASLRPSIAAAMVRLGGASPGDLVLDPMCGAGTLLAEQVELARLRNAGHVRICGGDVDPAAIRASSANLRRFQPELLARWDARRLPFTSGCIDRVLSNPPFGRQIGEPHEMAALYQRVVAECDRVLKPGGRSVLLVGEPQPLLDAASQAGWQAQKQFRIRVLGLPAFLSVWRKPAL